MTKTEICFGVLPLSVQEGVYFLYGIPMDLLLIHSPLLLGGTSQDAVYRRKSSGKDIYPATCDGVPSNFGVLARSKQNLSLNAMRENTYSYEQMWTVKLTQRTALYLGFVFFHLENRSPAVYDWLCRLFPVLPSKQRSGWSWPWSS